MAITKEATIKKMNEHGYTEVSAAGDDSWVGFSKDINGIRMSATVYLGKESVTLTGGILKMACTLRCESFDIMSKRFGEFEKTLYLYAKVCLQIDELAEACDISTIFDTAVKGVSEGVNEGVKTLEDRIATFKAEVITIGKEKGYPPLVCKKFFDYWSETNSGGKKMRWEIQKTKGGVFNTAKRMVTWMQKEGDFKATFKDRDDVRAEKLNNKLKETKQTINTKELF